MMTISEEEYEYLLKNSKRYELVRTKDWFNPDYCVVMKPKEAVRPGNDCPSHSRLDALLDKELKS